MTTQLPDMLGHQPRYMQLANTLLNEIKSGRYPVGSYLPTEYELCDQFGVSRFTVREAVKQLVQKGLLVRQRGVGTQVRSDASSRGYVQVMSGISDLSQYVSDTYLQIQNREIIVIDAPLAALLKASVGETWLHITGMRYTRDGNLPICCTEIYIAPQFRSIQHVEGALDRPVYTLIEEQFRAAIEVVEQEIRPVMLSDAERSQLDVPARSLGLLVSRRYIDERGDLAELAISVHPESRFTYLATFRRHWSVGDKN